MKQRLTRWMNPEEYTNLERVERRHWYYAGKRQLVREWLERVGPPRREETLLDCGAGTGLFAEEMASRCRVLVLDDHEESLRRLRERFPAEQVLALNGGEVPLADAAVHYITALDVLEHVPDDGAVARGFARLLKRGGIVVVTVPAGMSLWSDWDVSLHHFRRYGRPQLRALFAGPEWEILYLNYTNTLIFPVAWALRRWRRWRGAGLVRPEDRMPPAWLNAGLRRVFVRMAHWRLPLPFGLSLLLVARRR